MPLTSPEPLLLSFLMALTRVVTWSRPLRVVLQLRFDFTTQAAPLHAFVTFPLFHHDEVQY